MRIGVMFLGLLPLQAAITFPNSGFWTGTVPSLERLQALEMVTNTPYVPVASVFPFPSPGLHVAVTITFPQHPSVISNVGPDVGGRTWGASVFVMPLIELGVSAGEPVEMLAQWADGVQFNVCCSLLNWVDPPLPGSADLSSVSNPEPGSLWLVGLVGVLLAYRGRGRFGRQQRKQ